LWIRRKVRERYRFTGSRNDVECSSCRPSSSANRTRGRKVVDDLDLEISQGEVVGLLGPNGAGKTTTFYILVGLAQPDSGRVLLNGDDITDLPMYLRARSGIIYLPQEPSVFRQLTVEENLLAVLETLPLTAATTTRPAGGIVGPDETGNRAVQRSVHIIGRRAAAVGNRAIARPRTRVYPLGRAVFPASTR